MVKCILCDRIPVYNHQNGIPVAKCPTVKCLNNLRWLRYKSCDEDLYDKQFEQIKRNNHG